MTPLWMVGYPIPSVSYSHTLLCHVMELYVSLLDVTVTSMYIVAASHDGLALA